MQRTTDVSRAAFVVELRGNGHRVGICLDDGAEQWVQCLDALQVPLGKLLACEHARRQQRLQFRYRFLHPDGIGRRCGAGWNCGVCLCRYDGAQATSKQNRAGNAGFYKCAPRHWPRRQRRDFGIFIICVHTYLVPWEVACRQDFDWPRERTALLRVSKVPSASRLVLRSPIGTRGEPRHRCRRNCLSFFVAAAAAKLLTAATPAPDPPRCRPSRPSRPRTAAPPPYQAYPAYPHRYGETRSIVCHRH